jgi:hypothetical protein
MPEKSPNLVTHIVLISLFLAGFILVLIPTFFIHREVEGSTWSVRWQLFWWNCIYYVPAVLLMLPAILRYRLWSRD